jgi:1-acyl-sn-glycerol-3-phosphate acyltransferase
MLARSLRTFIRGIHLAALLIAATLDGKIRHPKCGPEGAVWVHRWCRRIVDSMGLRYTIEGPVPKAGPMAVVSNHMSYLDVLIYSATTPFIMVSKTEVRGWPLIGWITAQAGTIYVQRADVAGGQTQTHAEINEAMAKAFRSGLPVLFYPEGTTTDGSGVLPFRRGLFHSVLANQVPMRAAALTYRFDEPNPGASIAEDVCFVGDSEFATHILRFLPLRGVHVHLRFGEREIEGNDRFTLAEKAHAAVAELYSELSGGEQTAIAERREYLFDRPVEGLGALHGERGVGG